MSEGNHYGTAAKTVHKLKCEPDEQFVCDELLPSSGGCEWGSKFVDHHFELFLADFFGPELTECYYKNATARLDILKHFEMLKPYIPPVDVCIHLHVRVEQAMERISKRGRGFESGIEESYLHKLQAQVMQIPDRLPKDTKYIKLDWYDMDESQRLEVIRGLL